MPTDNPIIATASKAVSSTSEVVQLQLIDHLDILSLMDWLSLITFFCLWVGYVYYAKAQIGLCPCLAGELAFQRQLWMQSLLARDNRIADVAIIANVERYVMFYTSSSLLILAGVLAALTNSEGISELTKQIPTLGNNTSVEWTLKLLLTLLIFIYVFFKLTWSVREYGFASVLIGAAPLPNDIDCSVKRQNFAKGMAHLLDRASHDFNAGIRAYYFALTVLAWFFSPWLFILATVIVVVVLYRREFTSESLEALVELRGEHLL